MSWRLLGLNFLLRTLEKPALARIRDPDIARARFDRAAMRLNRRTPEVAVNPERIAGPGGAIPVEWISRPGADRRRVILYLHGGAFIMGSPETHRRVAAALAAAAEARVMLPDYRLAPEHPFPAAPDDALAAYRHLMETGYDPRALALAGDSAGAGLCLTLLADAAAAGLPPPAAVALFSPWADLTMTRDSLRRNRRRDPMLPVSQFRRVVDFYLAGADAADPRASPALAAFRAPPATLIQASRVEILEDDARAVAEALRAAGGDVRLEWSPRTPHAWHFFANWLPEADAALSRAGAFLRDRLAAGD